MPELRTKSNWVFDLDGTLVDSFSPFFAILADIFSEHGIRFTDNLRIPALTQQLPEFFEHHLRQMAASHAMSILRERSMDDARKIQPFEGMMGAIQLLSDEGARIAVWTNRDLTSARLILKYSGLEPYVELCVSGTCTSQRKPHPEGLLRIMDHFGCAAGSVTMVGDHDHDVLAAKNVGARAIRASWHSHWTVEPCLHSDFQFHKVQEFSKWLGVIQ